VSERASVGGPGAWLWLSPLTSVGWLWPMKIIYLPLVFSEVEIYEANGRSQVSCSELAVVDGK
jgi:hypothetical protein